MLRKLIAGADFSAQVLRQLVTDLNQNFTALERRFLSVSATTAVALPALHTVYFVTTSGGNVTLTLPPAADCTGKQLTVKKLNAPNTLTLDGNASETIDGAATLALTAQWATRTLYCNGSAWFVVAS